MRAPLVALVLLLTMVVSPASAQSPSEEVLAVEGAANPLDAPVLGSGAVVDTILETETLWYAVDAGNGQQVAATVSVLGQPDGPESERRDLIVILTDQQRQPLAEDIVPFDGLADASVILPGQEIPSVAGDRPLLSVALSAGADPTPIAGQGYRLSLSISVTGTRQPLPQTDTPADTAPPDAAADADPLFTEPPAPPAEDPDYVGDLFPFAALALAVGGFAGFELSRRGL